MNVNLDKVDKIRIADESDNTLDVFEWCSATKETKIDSTTILTIRKKDAVNSLSNIRCIHEPENAAPTELQKLQWQNKALLEALQYLVDTKERKDTIGKDSIYMQRKAFGWMKAKSILSDSKVSEK